MKRKVFGVVGIVILVAAVITIFNGLFIVHEGEYGFVTQFGAIVRIEETPGLKFKIPFIQESNTMTKKMMVYDINPSEVLTEDKKAMVVDSYALWQIQDVTTFVRTLGNLAEMNKRIDASVYSVIKNIMGTMAQDEIITDEETSRNSLNQQITEIVREQLQGYGVAIHAVEIRRYDLPDDNLSAVYNRMISERAQIAAMYKADGEYQANIIRNRTDKDVEIALGEARAAAERLAGEGEQGYIQTMSEIYSDPDMASFYTFVRELEALQRSLAGTGQKTVVLGPDNPIARILSGLEATLPEAEADRVP
ncbi:MAG: protease modulator HflC [Bacillota bacterium]|nr:protease modulator HflC [Bacillota bacterium]